MAHHTSLIQLGRFLSGRPLVALAMALVVGIILGDARPTFTVCFLVLCALGLVAGLSGGPRVSPLGLLVAAFGLGGWLMARTLTPAPDDVSLLADTPVRSLEMVIIRPVYRTASATAYYCEAIRAQPERGREQRVSGRALVELQGRGEPLTALTRLVLECPSITRPPEVRNWYQKDRRRMLARQRVFAVIQAEAWEVEPGGPSVRAWAALPGDALRSRMTATLRQTVRGRHAERDASLLASMVFGQQAMGVDQELEDLFRRTGTIHLLVVSGAQVTLLVGLVISLAGSPARLRWWQTVLLMPLLLGFALVAGTGPSVLRSLVMCMLWLLAMAAGRQHDVASALAAAALFLCLLNPAVVFDIGAQLTFAATIGVVAAASGPWVRGKRSAADRIEEMTGLWDPMFPVRVAVAGTVGVWLLVTPLLAHHFAGIPLLGSVANVLSIPLSGAVVVLGLLCFGLGLIWPALAAVPCGLARVPLWTIIGVNAACARLPGAYLDGVPLSSAACVAWLGVAGTGLYLVRSGRLAALWAQRRGAVITASAVALSVGAVVFAVREVWPRPWRLLTFDVGEGQCTLIETPDRRAVLVDAGGRGRWSPYEVANEIVRPYLLARGHRQVDLLLVSHPDSDHYQVARVLLRRLPIRMALVSDRRGERGYQRFLKALREAGTDVRMVSGDTEVRAGPLRLRILWPPPLGSAVPVPQGDNNASLVVRAEMDGITALLPGDLETEGMDALLRAVPPSALRADFLQLPHHGRSSAAHEAFFAAVGAAVAVSSRYGEPGVRLGDTLASRYARLITTERSGAVMVEKRGARLQVRTYLGPR